MARKGKNTEGPTYFTTFQVAKMLGVSPPTVVNWVKSGLLKAHRTPGGHRRIRLEDFLTFCKEQNYPIPANLTAPPGGPPRGRVSPTRRIMIVDDDRDFAQTVAVYMQQKGLFEVEIADSGLGGLLVMGRFRPSIVLMDIRMPGMDGFEALRALRADPEMSSVPVIACTATREAALEQRALAEGFDHYLQKPLKLDRLLEIVLALLSRVEPR